MDIVCCTDHNYVMPTGIMILSLSINNLNEEIVYHIICNKDVTVSDKNDICRTVSKYNHSIKFYQVDEKLNEYFTIGKDGQPTHITIASYYRLLLAKILPQNITKCLYIDSDIIVRNNIKDLYNIDINNSAAGVVIDMNGGDVAPFRRLKYSSQFGYFNAGVMLVNLTFWRENNLFEEYLDFAKKYPERVIFHDQDILNYVLKDKKVFMPIKYNVQHGFLFKEPNVSWELDKEIENAISSPIIIHYTEASKPWYIDCSHPYKEEFLKYKELSIWRNSPCIYYKRIKKDLKYYIKQILFFFNILKKPVIPSLYRNNLSL